MRFGVVPFPKKEFQGFIMSILHSQQEFMRNVTKHFEYLLWHSWVMFVIYYHVILSIVLWVETLAVNLIRGTFAPLARPAIRFATGSHMNSLVNSALLLVWRLLSCRMWGLVALCIDISVSEEHIICILKVVWSVVNYLTDHSNLHSYRLENLHPPFQMHFYFVRFVASQL